MPWRPGYERTLQPGSASPEWKEQALIHVVIPLFHVLHSFPTAYSAAGGAILVARSPDSGALAQSREHDAAAVCAAPADAEEHVPIDPHIGVVVVAVADVDADVAVVGQRLRRGCSWNCRR